MQETESKETTSKVILISVKKERSLETFLPRICVVFNRLELFRVTLKRIRTYSLLERIQTYSHIQTDHSLEKRIFYYQSIFNQNKQNVENESI